MESHRDSGGAEGDVVGGSVGCLALLPAPGAARCRSLGADGLSGQGGSAGLRVSPSQGCRDSWLPHQQPLPSSTGAVPATGFLKQSGINIDSKGFIVVNKVSLGGSPCQGGEQEELSPLSSEMSFPEAPHCCGRGVSSAEVLGASRRSAWEPPASEGFANPSPGCCGLGPALSCPGMVWIF